MIVEDNSKMRSMVKKLLTQNLDQISDVCECSNGQQAIDQCPLFLPDWILMDIQMNGMSGLIAAEQILQNDPQAKIIILTQFDDASYRETARKMGARAYVLKDSLMEVGSIIKNVF